ncbi:hypothetical protein DPMN_181251 [Dreissena polymorpha]|uniref:Uncharacterized protein n=1 Tax=Dreissena polymorpha TaxID=45954 RepID=A0A9D4DCH1_DREPO|nr:hypothetical protein DPMN_181251 [Dreissena polymorpha]
MEPEHGPFWGNLKNGSNVVVELMTSRPLREHHIHDDTATWPILNVSLGAPGLIMEPCIVEIYRIRDVQYQFEVNRCRNEEVNLQGSNANSVGGDSGQDGRTAEITT